MMGGAEKKQQLHAGEFCVQVIFWPNSGLFPLHNVYIVQYVFLPTEQSETYFKNFILTYDLTYICPGLFDWKENTFFFIFVYFKL